MFSPILIEDDEKYSHIIQHMTKEIYMILTHFKNNYRLECRCFSLLTVGQYGQKMFTAPHAQAIHVIIRLIKTVLPWRLSRSETQQHLAQVTIS